MILSESVWLGEQISKIARADLHAGQFLALQLYTLVFLIAVDVITGLIKSYKRGTITSVRNFEGGLKKLTLLFIVVSTMVLDILSTSLIYFIDADSVGGFDLAAVGFPLFSTLMILWIVVGELISIAENLRCIGVPLPKFITKGLLHIRGAVDKKGLSVVSRVKEKDDGEIAIENRVKMPCSRCGEDQEKEKR